MQEGKVSTKREKTTRPKRGGEEKGSIFRGSGKGVNACVGGKGGRSISKKVNISFVGGGRGK